jgi:hypothetical protein
MRVARARSISSSRDREGNCREVSPAAVTPPAGLVAVVETGWVLGHIQQTDYKVLVHSTSL